MFIPDNHLTPHNQFDEESGSGLTASFKDVEMESDPALRVIIEESASQGIPIRRELERFS
jgi:hypothetical protein